MRKTPLMLAALAATLLAACGQDSAKQAAAPAPAAAPVAAAPVAAANAAGESTYKKVCALCHASGVAGAPIPGNKDDWAPRVAQGKDVLYKHSIEGYTGAKGMMPARGGNPNLSDDDMKAAVDYMLSKLPA
jgi:cytochrome c5